ncbi:hypothetical protein [Fischerella thermalis]|uniref:hypothetical protein n=1 Tax=Fischerella thermalis TaxID=372787 RepID=UPI0011AF0FC9|nr:hypothetical protein [Fischerella thermalis]
MFFQLSTKRSHPHIKMRLVQFLASLNQNMNLQFTGATRRRDVALLRLFIPIRGMFAVDGGARQTTKLNLR